MYLLPALALSAGLWSAPMVLADDPLPGDEAVVVSIEMLTSVEYRRGKELPEDIQDLDGKTIEIEGYMAIGTLEGIEKFELVPEPCECGRSKVNHFIDVTLTEGRTTFKPGRFTVRGKFSVGEVEEDGYVVSLYFTSATLLYLAIRRICDGQGLTEIWEPVSDR